MLFVVDYKNVVKLNRKRSTKLAKVIGAKTYHRRAAKEGKFTALIGYLECDNVLGQTIQNNARKVLNKKIT